MKGDNMKVNVGMNNTIHSLVKIIAQAKKKTIKKIIREIIEEIADDYHITVERVKDEDSNGEHREEDVHEGESDSDDSLRKASEGDNIREDRAYTDEG